MHKLSFSVLFKLSVACISHSIVSATKIDLEEYSSMLLLLPVLIKVVLYIKLIWPKDCLLKFALDLRMHTLFFSFMLLLIRDQ